MTLITINGIAIDPAAPKPMLASFGLASADAKKSDYLVVQTKSPLDKDQRQELEKAGATILEAVPGDAYICKFPKTSLANIRGLNFVTWADVFLQAVKISPGLRKVAPVAGGVSLSAMALAAPGELDSTEKTVDVVLHRNVNAKKAAKEVAAAAHVPVQQVQVGTHKLRLTIKARRLADVSALDQVRHIEEVFPAKLHNSVARKVMRVPSGATSPGAEGRGEIVAVADTGFDKGSTTNPHPAFTGRVKKLYALGRTGKKDDPHGHGTHVAGSVLGDGTATGEGAIRGTAPAAKLVLQSLLDLAGGLGGIPADLNDLLDGPYTTDKARIHTNSWGSTGNFGLYDQQAMEVDNFVYNHRDMLICFAAGNEGQDGDANGRIDPNSVTPPGTAKNCLTVGASENNRPSMSLTYGDGFGYPAEPIRSDRMANNPEGIVAFSSRGPVHDGRIKPDLVAPGTYVLSARSRATTSQGWGVPSSDSRYMFDGGTSMATPLVAGCVAVTRAFLKSVHGMTKPSAALLKALPINGARDLAGQYLPSEADSIPNNSEGFGRLDLQAVVGPYADGESLQFWDEGAALDVNEKSDQSIAIPAGTTGIKATLVWVDPPGEGLQSDLDLIVKIGSQERHGNMPAESTGFDRINNVEQIAWENIPNGACTVSVVCNRVTLSPQNFALVVRIT
jgi:hypothetical protein